MLCSRSDTYRTAWLRRTALTVMGCSSCGGSCWSGDDAEATGPGDLLAGGEGELEEADGLELAGPRERPGVDRLEAARGDDAGQGRLGVGVVAGDQDRGGQRADGAGGESAGGGGVEVLQALGVRRGGGDLGEIGRASCRERGW